MEIILYEIIAEETNMVHLGKGKVMRKFSHIKTFELHHFFKL